MGLFFLYPVSCFFLYALVLHLNNTWFFTISFEMSVQNINERQRYDIVRLGKLLDFIAAGQIPQ